MDNIKGNLMLRNVLLEGVTQDIYIKEGVISAIGSGLRCEDGDKVLDGHGMTVLPAFVNMHTHSGMTLFRGICEDMPLSAWLDSVWKAETALDPDLIYWGTRLACLEMIRTGTAVFADMYWNIDVAARAVSDSGMRALLTYCFLDGGDTGKQMAQREECSRMYDISRSWPSRVMFGVSIHAHYTVSDGNMLWAADLHGAARSVCIPIFRRRFRKRETSGPLWHYTGQASVGHGTAWTGPDCSTCAVAR